MSKTASGIGLSGLAVTVAFLGAGCMAGQATTSPSTRWTEPPAPSPISSARAVVSATPGGSSPAAVGPRLIVLADGAGHGLGLWAIDMQGHWTTLGSTPGATALGRTAGSVAIATGHQIDLRPVSDLTHRGQSAALEWAGTAPSAPITGLDGSAAGRLAFVTSDDQSLEYAIADTAGSVTALAPAPTQTFAPLISWLGETRLLVLSTDNQQTSRLAIVDTGAHSIDLLPALTGVRWFGLSSDRETIAAATESGIWVGPVEAFQADTTPETAITIDGSQVVWALALDATGSSVYMLSGTEAADGTVGAVRELGYAKQGSSWTRVLDSPAPFDRAVAQVYLPE
jgi:Lipoprotein LpqB beta-propeller domain